MERISATLPAELDADWRRFHRAGGSGTEYVRGFVERAGQATAARVEAAQWRARAQAPDLEQLRADYAREAADIEAERDSWRREKAGWADEQREHDAALLATADELARLQTLVDALTANWDALLKRFLEVATAGVPEAIERRAEARSWAHCVAHLDNPEILARVIQAGMAAGQFNGVIEARAQALFRQHLAAADEAARRQAQADALAAIKAKGRAERARYRY